MTASRRAIVELVLAGFAMLGCAVSWWKAQRTVGVAAIADGQPATTSVVYDPQLVLLALLLATTAGILAVIGTARLRRAQSAPKASDC